ncbi:MAG: hypothetical protein AAGA03_02210 [Planctomycetota bacterium]
MTFSDESYNLRIELDTKGCTLSAAEIEQMEEDMSTLRRQTEDFPVSNLYITVVRHPRAGDYHVKTTLALSGRKLFTGDRGTSMHPTFESCLRKLTKKVRAFKSQMRVGSDTSKLSEGTRQAVEPTRDVNIETLTKAVRGDDYESFRREIDVFEPSLIERVERWLHRYPELKSQFESAIPASDVVEEVFLNAFDQFDSRSHSVPPGDWLDSLINPSIQALLQKPDEEFEQICYSSSLMQR